MNFLKENVDFYRTDDTGTVPYTRHTYIILYALFVRTLYVFVRQFMCSWPQFEIVKGDVP